MSPVLFGFIGIALLFLFLLTSMPVAFAMLSAGVIGFALIVSPYAALSMAAMDLLDSILSYNLTVIPLFVLMGQTTFHAGISTGLFRAAYAWMGHLPGGLAMATIGACTGFGAICGSGPATAATMAAVAMPEMRRYKYSDGLAGGTVAAGGSLGMLIPPSVVFIVYALLTEQSIGELFLAGIVPGLFIALLFCLSIAWRCSRNPLLGPPGPKSSWKERFISIGGIAETLVLFVTVMGGMFLGLFTAIEAAAVGAAGSLLIAFFKRALSRQVLKKIIKETVRTSCMVLFIVTSASIFGRFLAVSQIPFIVASWFSALPLPGFLIIILIILFFLIAGCFIDALALVLLTIPIFFPVIRRLNYDPVWFGVMIVVVTQMSVITPPVGVNVYVVSGIERDIPLQEIFRGSMPFLFMLIVAAAALLVFPQLCLFLPYAGR
ncbi:MAG: TRAP transporter large permease [Spirochaetales bacterium]|jgi:tripartite ATP-independent transporter DctM subunit|nr:TRAP transporter large permease [Spirochaetales bacterium]